MARRGSRARFVRPAPRTKMWIGNALGEIAVAANTKVFAGQLNAAALLLRPFTILRTHISLLWTTDQEAADESPAAGYGEIVVTDTATGIGVTAIPDPSAQDGDPEADWYVWQGMVLDYQFVSNTGSPGTIGQHYTVDSKAMRKVGPDDDVASMVSSNNNAGAVLHINGRQLIQLH